MATIYLCGKKQDYQILVDDEDFERVSALKWSMTGYEPYKYATNRTRIDDKIVTLKMHRFIMNAPPDMVVDHINGDTFDNRKSNLRVCTAKQNSFNKRKSTIKKYSSKYKGVTAQPNNKYLAFYKREHIGRYATEEEAALAYNRVVLELYGEYANLNIVD